MYEYMMSDRGFWFFVILGVLVLIGLWEAYRKVDEVPQETISGACVTDGGICPEKARAVYGVHVEPTSQHTHSIAPKSASAQKSDSVFDSNNMGDGGAATVAMHNAQFAQSATVAGASSDMPNPQTVAGSAQFAQNTADFAGGAGDFGGRGAGSAPQTQQPEKRFWEKWFDGGNKKAQKPKSFGSSLLTPTYGEKSLAHLDQAKKDAFVRKGNKVKAFFVWLFTLAGLALYARVWWVDHHMSAWLDSFIGSF